MPRTTLPSPFDVLASDWFGDLGFPTLFAVAPPGSRELASHLPAKAEIPLMRLALDIQEREGHFLIHASLPGFKKDEVNVEIADGVLTITASHAETKEAEKSEQAIVWHTRERRLANLSRSVRLPEGVTGEGIKAELNDGVLTLTVPQPPRQQLAGRKIAVS